MLFCFCLLKLIRIITKTIDEEAKKLFYNDIKEVGSRLLPSTNEVYIIKSLLKGDCIL